jgi:hypothetical protein
MVSSESLRPLKYLPQSVIPDRLVFQIELVVSPVSAVDLPNDSQIYTFAPSTLTLQEKHPSVVINLSLDADPYPSFMG